MVEPVEPFSVGEKARLVLALVAYRRPNLLLLDEPTNHLDLEMRHALGMALQEYAGAIVLVSHDRYLLRLVADRLWLVADGRARPFEGDLEDYAAWLKDTADNANAAEPDGRVEASLKDRKRLEAQRRQRLSPLRARVTQADSELERIAAEASAVEARLAAPEIYAADRRAALAELLLARADLKRRLERAEEHWLECTDALEQAARDGSWLAAASAATPAALVAAISCWAACV